MPTASLSASSPRSGKQFAPCQRRLRSRDGTEVFEMLERTNLEAISARWRDGQPHTLHRDVESRSTASLKTIGAHRYAADPGTEVLCVAYAVDDEPVQLWVPGDPVPPEFVEAARDPNWIISAHNDQFESAIERDILAPRHGWPIVPLERHRCTMAMA